VRTTEGETDKQTMTTVFAKGFDNGTDDEAIRTHFGAVGTIKELYFQSRVSAVITYEEASSATRAVQELHESTMKDQKRYVDVKLDDPDRERKGKGKGEDAKGKGKGKASGKGDKGSGKGSRKGGENTVGRAIFVSGFDFGTDEAALEWHFKPMGAIETLHFQSNGSAVITFVKAATAEKAIAKLDQSTMDGQSRYMDVKMDDPDRERKGKGKGSGKSSGKGKSKYRD